MTKNAFCVISICTFSLFFALTETTNSILTTNEDTINNTDVANKRDDRLLLISTLDGRLTAVDRDSGQVKWTIADKPTVTVPLDITDAILPLVLPDPRNGSLYILGKQEEPLRKLPFTIPELVANSPCRSSDGILYTGKKKDIWFSLDPNTGQKENILGWDTTLTCPIESQDAVYIGRTQYSILMVDSRNTQRKWNVTFYDYSSAPMSNDQLRDYDLVHFTSTSTGRIVTMSRIHNTVFWEEDLGSPVVAIYLLESSGLLNVPFTSVANHTLIQLIELSTYEETLTKHLSHLKLYPTLYVGIHRHGLYALSSYVDQNLIAITASETGPLLLEGPDSSLHYQSYLNYKVPRYYTSDDFNNPNFVSSGDDDYIYIGHYNIPDSITNALKFSGQNVLQLKLITDESGIANTVNKELKKSEEKSNSDDSRTSEKSDSKPQEENVLPSVIVQTTIPEETQKQADSESFVFVRFDGKRIYNYLKWRINKIDNKGLKILVIILCGLLVGLSVHYHKQMRSIQNEPRSNQSSSSGLLNFTNPIVEETGGDIVVTVGKIVIHQNSLLGKGCEGTFVFRGEFEGRPVAVKRLLPDSFTIADREVALLRESDTHPNVVRYFCTEQDRMFKYIALELCLATLQDYVQEDCSIEVLNSITALDILKQATCGLAHLHSLQIVHRDIKPHNVLISSRSTTGEFRAMISDFGLCKKLQTGHNSFSRRSGVTGTDGWIAPEMLNSSDKITYAVDMFSLGCLFYYVLSKGIHPFGDVLHRQANIISHIYNLDNLKSENWEVAVQKPLIAALLSPEYKRRPNCSAILKHPMFWNKNRILAFFQDVSDRVEKVDIDDAVFQSLEFDCRYVVRKDWRYHVDEEVVKDLRKYRSYRGDSVRDLLRALRNKKHHYRELTQEAQELLGEIPEAFTIYWLSRFPLLLVHTWLSMQIVASEKTFKNYYHYSFKYKLISFNDAHNVLNSIAENYLNNFEENEIFLKQFDDAFENKQNKYNKNKFIKHKYKQYQYLKNYSPNYDNEPVHNVTIEGQENTGLFRNNNPKIKTGECSTAMSTMLVSKNQIDSETIASLDDSKEIECDDFSIVLSKRKQKHKIKKSEDSPVWLVNK